MLACDRLMTSVWRCVAMRGDAGGVVRTIVGTCVPCMPPRSARGIHPYRKKIVIRDIVQFPETLEREHRIGYTISEEKIVPVPSPFVDPSTKKQMQGRKTQDWMSIVSLLAGCTGPHAAVCELSFACSASAP